MEPLLRGLLPWAARLLAQVARTSRAAGRAGCPLDWQPLS